MKKGGEGVTSASERGEVMLWVGAAPVCDRYVPGEGSCRPQAHLTHVEEDAVGRTRVVDRYRSASPPLFSVRSAMDSSCG